MRPVFFSILLWLWCGHSYAKSFGVIGEVFPVAEKSFLELIEERLAVLESNGELEAMNQRWIKTVARHTNRPLALELSRTDHSIKHYYVPETALNQDITDGRGQVLYSKGAYVNALERMPAYNPCWLFFNADDKAQMSWAEQQKKVCANAKFILTGGTIQSAEKSLKSTIYFDQAGRITKKLNIGFVPAIVTRAGNRLLIAEQAIKENGDVL